MTLVIPDHVKKNGPWSFTKAGVLSECSQKFYYQYGPDRKNFPKALASKESRIGSVVHRAIELALDGTKVPKAFEMATSLAELVHDEVEEVNTFHEQTQHFVNRIAACREKYSVRPQNVILEYKMGVTYDFKMTRFWDDDGFFRGALDLMLVTSSGDAIVIDHKSGKSKELSTYSNQCKAYCVLALAMRPEIRSVQTAIHHVKTEELLWNPSVSTKVIREQYQPWLLQLVIDASKALLEPPKTTVSKLCDWCDYQKFCPEFSKK